MKPEYKIRIRDAALLTVGVVLFATLLAVVYLYVIAPLTHSPQREPAGSLVSQSSGETSSEPSSSRASAPQPASSREVSSSPPPSSEASSEEESSSEAVESEAAGELATVWVQNEVTGSQRNLTAEEAQTIASLYAAVGLQPSGIEELPDAVGRVVITTTTGELQEIVIATRSRWSVGGVPSDVVSGGEAFLNALDSLDVFGGALAQLEP